MRSLNANCDRTPLTGSTMRPLKVRAVSFFRLILPHRVHIHRLQRRGTETASKRPWGLFASWMPMKRPKGWHSNMASLPWLWAAGVLIDRQEEGAYQKEGSHGSSVALGGRFGDTTPKAFIYCPLQKTSLLFWRLLFPLVFMVPVVKQSFDFLQKV